MFAELRSRAEGYRVVGDLPVTDRTMRDALWVGVYPGLSAPQLEHMARTLQNVLGGR